MLEDGTLQPITINGDGTCGPERICEHRWRQIANMVMFSNSARGTKVENWWDNGNNQIAFSRGNFGFIAFNGEFNQDMNVTVQTGLPAGTYCDIISGNLCGMFCTGAFVNVRADGMGTVNIPSYGFDGVLAIIKDVRVPNL